MLLRPQPACVLPAIDELAAERDFAVGDDEVVRAELDVGVAGRVEELGREQVGPEVGLRDVDALDGTEPSSFSRRRSR